MPAKISVVVADFLQVRVTDGAIYK